MHNIDISPEQLAINGGPKLRHQAMPWRKLFGEAELDIVEQVFRDSWQAEVDFGFQGKYEELFTDAFCRFQEGGYADAVSSGTAAVFLALKVLDIEAGSDVVVSPVTNPGSVTPAILQGFKIAVADAQPDSFLPGPDEFERAITSNTRAAILTHSGGRLLDLEPICEIARARDIKLIEDCSQAHGARYKGQRVGRFGDLAVFSTMYSKTLATGGCGGLLYTRDEDYYWASRSHADRGKDFCRPDFDPRNAAEFSFPAMNFNLDEVSCAIGLSVLGRLQQIIDRRVEIAQKIDRALAASAVVYPCGDVDVADSSLSPFYHTVRVDVDRLRVSKRDFAQAIIAEGIPINPHYSEVVVEWPWVQEHLVGRRQAPNAADFRNRSFNLLFNERLGDGDIDDIIASIIKVEAVLAEI